MKKLLSLITLFAILCYGLSVSADTIDVNINSVNVTVDGHKITTPNLLWQGTTYVPIRSVSEALKCTVLWNSSTNTAVITKNPTTIDYDLLNMFNAQYKSAQLRRLIEQCESICDKLDYEYEHQQFGSTSALNQQIKNQVQTYIDNEIINNAASKLGYDYSSIAHLTMYISAALEFLSLSNDYLALYAYNPTISTIEGYQNTRLQAITLIENAHTALNKFEDDMMNYVVYNYSK